MRTEAEQAELMARVRSRASHTNRGRKLEQLLDLVHRRYDRQGLAYVQRNGVPFVPMKRAPGQKGKPMGTVGPEAPPDYTVVAQGFVFLVDAKSTLETRWSFSLLETHQALAFDAAEAQGATAGLVIALEDLDVIGWLPWRSIARRWWEWHGSIKRAAPGLASVGRDELQLCRSGDWLPHAVAHAKTTTRHHRRASC